MKTHRSVFSRMAVLVFCVSMALACRSSATNANEPTVTPPNQPATDSANTNANANETAAMGANANIANANMANANQQAAQAGARPDCGNCWVHIFDDKNFDATDDNHLICGPGKWPNLRNLPGAAKINWGDEIESLRVGPGATVIVWVGEQYTGASQTFGPGAQNANLKLIPALSDNISSIEIRCQ